MLAALTVALTAFCASKVAAEGVTLDDPQLLPSESGGYALFARLHFDFSSRMADMVARGITLHFVQEFELERPRWYWADEVMAKKRLSWRLSYHALTRQYRLSSGALYQSFPTLGDVLQRLSRISNWGVVERALAPGARFQAGFRFWLDVSQLPKPFQFSSLMGQDLDFDTGWRRWTFVAPAARPSEPEPSAPIPAVAEPVPEAP